MSLLFIMIIITIYLVIFRQRVDWFHSRGDNKIKLHIKKGKRIISRKILHDDFLLKRKWKCFYQLYSKES